MNKIIINSEPAVVIIIMSTVHNMDDQIWQRNDYHLKESCSSKKDEKDDKYQVYHNNESTLADHIHS